MKSSIRLNDFKKSELLEIFRIADSIDQYDGFLKGKTIVMFFPASSIRTRVSFELWLRISNPELFIGVHH